MKREIFDLRWNADVGSWTLRRRNDRLLVSVGGVKKRFISQSAALMREYRGDGRLLQMVVYNKNGRIAFERTYGKDPRRRKG